MDGLVQRLDAKVGLGHLRYALGHNRPREPVHDGGQIEEGLADGQVSASRPQV